MMLPLAEDLNGMQLAPKALPNIFIISVTLLHAVHGAAYPTGDKGEKLRCFKCDSVDDPRCGVNFTIPRDEAIQCYLENHRCRTVKKESPDGFEKIYYRDCGAILGVELKKKDVKGCTRMYYHKTEEHENVCFCNELYCNAAALSLPAVSHVFLLLLCTFLDVFPTRVHIQ